MSARMPAAFAALTVLTAACGAGTNPDVAAREAEEAARRAITAESLAFAEAFRSGDVATLVAKTTDDIVLTMQAGEIRSRAATERFWRDFFDNGSVTSLHVTPEQLLIDGDLAVEAGEYHETIVMSGEAPMDISGSYLMVWVRQPDGAWRIGRFVAVDRVPAE